MVLQLCISNKLLGQKQKGDAINLAALLGQKRRRGAGRSKSSMLTNCDLQVKQLAEELKMLVKELLRELPAMLADNGDNGDNKQEQEREEAGAD
jgi:hypothetical protein